MGSQRVYRERKYTFGQQLLTLRTRTTLTQSALVQQVGVHRRSLQNWETGEQRLPLEQLLGAMLGAASAAVDCARSSRRRPDRCWQAAPTIVARANV